VEGVRLLTRSPLFSDAEVDALIAALCFGNA